MDVEKFTVSDVLSPLANSAIANESFAISKDILRLMPQSNSAMAGFQLHSISEALKPLMSTSESLRSLLRTGPALKSVLVSTAELSERLRVGMTVAQSTVAFSKDLQAHYANLTSARSPLIAAERMLEAYSTVQSSLPALREIEIAVRNIASASETLYSVSSLIRQDNFIRLYTNEIKMLSSNRASEFLAEQTRLIHDAFRPTLDAFSMFRDTSPRFADSLISTFRTPVREHFLTTDLLHVLTEPSENPRFQHEERTLAIKDADEQMLLTLPDALSELNSDLLQLWQGAWDAYTSNNSDRTRHALVSVRELVTHVLHILSPDDQIKRWSKAPEHYNEGRPTRKARLLFIYSAINDGPMRDHFEKEIEASLSLVNLFQQGTHQICPAFDDDQVRAILRRVHSTLCALVEAHMAKKK